MAGGAHQRQCPVHRTARQTTVAQRRGPREPEPIADVFLALVAAHGWTLGTAGGGLRDHWPTIVGPAAAHWHLAGYDPTTRRLRVAADSPPWAAQLRPNVRRIVTALDRLRPGTVTAIDVRVGPAPVVQHDQDPDDRPTRRDERPAAQPARLPLADDPRERMITQKMPGTVAQRLYAARDAGAPRAQQEAILAQALGEHYFKDGGRRATGLDVELNDIAWMDVEL
ncbi:DciA family protein [Kitasatospora sp. NPDC059599]|uniref:DciA family protein n=1 Tax=Kitasatospora sp. NPDC059599 TaxID=3346880 RepID=UPI0036B84B80